MKLLRYGPVGAERPGLLDLEGRIRSLHPLVPDFDCATLTPEWLERLRAVDIGRLPVVDGTPRLGMPVRGIRQVLAIGLNYRDHAAEAGFDIPPFPMLFSKSVGSLSGPFDPIAVPATAAKLDWEIELGVLIGTETRDVPVEAALGAVAGYCAAVDVSERSWQLERGGQMGKGKSFDGFTPVGPWLVTADELPDPQRLFLRLEVNGQRRQDGNTAGMIFPVAAIVAHVSTYQTLLPGDLIITGTPAGVAFGMKPPKYLAIGDRITCAVENLGEQAHEVVERRAR